MLIEKIEALRKRPKEVRNQYAFVISIVVTAVVAFGWLLTLPDRVSVPSGEEFINIDTQSGSMRALSDIKSKFTEMFSSMGASLSNNQPTTTLDVSSESSEEPESETAHSLDMDLLRQPAPAAAPDSPDQAIEQVVPIATSSTASE